MNTQGAHRYEDRLLEFAYGELPVAEARSIEAHVKGCARCTGALREIEGVRRQMSQLAPEPVPDAGLESLLAYAEQAARRTAAGPAPTRGWRRWVFGAVGAASLAAVLVVVGVVVNRPELKPVSPQAIQSQEAKAQAQAQAEGWDKSAGAPAQAPAPAVAAATPPVDTAAAAQPLAEGQDQELDRGLALEKNKEGDQLAQNVASNEEPPPEPKVGKAVGKSKGYDVQRVDVSPTGGKAEERKELDARYRESGSDRPDTMQNMAIGKGSRPVLPTTGTQGYAKSAEAADGEMMLPEDTKKAPAPAKPPPSSRTYQSFQKKASAPAPIPSKKKAAADVSGSGGGIGQLDSGRVGTKSSAGPAPSKGGAVDDSDFDSTFGGRGAGTTSGGSITRGGGTARPSGANAPLTSPASDPSPRANLDAELQAKQRAQAAESTRRDEQQKLERAKVAKVEEERAAERLAMKSAQAKDEPAPAAAPATAAPAPGGAPAPVAQAPSSTSSSSNRRGAAQNVAMSSPPPPPPAPSRQVTAPSEAEDEAPAQTESASIPLSSGASSSRKADAAQPSKVRTVNAQELFLAATRARPGSAEEINGLIIAVNAGLAGQYRIDALQRLCTRMETAGDSRAYDYCSAWASADPGSAVAMKRARAADDRWGPRAKARASKKAADDAAKLPAQAAPAVSY